ncbi:hypothetical protein MCP1_10042 [Candidatus Terasakiella magnetica]|nr:hypothetical protein MCP1_10042 [Candidatus Terasakiella magnetica]
MPDQTDPALADMEALGDTDVETSLTEVCTKASPAEVLGVVNALANGEGISERHVGKIASQMGIEPGEAMERAQAIHQAFVGQAMDTIGKSGLDAQEVVNWAWENRPDLMKKAISRHAADRTTKGYGDVVKAYLGGLEKASPQTILNAKLPPGCTARKGIRRHTATLEGLGGLGRRVTNPGPKGGRPGTAFYLTHEQAVFLIAKSETARADIELAHVAQVFTLYQQGDLVAANDDAQAQLDAAQAARLERLARHQEEKEARRVALRFLRRR